MIQFKRIFFKAFLASGLVLSFSCDKVNRGPVSGDEILMEEVLAKDSTEYSVFTPKIMEARGNSPRDYYRVRYNQIALKALDESGRLPEGESFPDGSLIVKEAYSDLNGEIIQYAIMKKSSNDPYQGEGWIWYEVDEDGDDAYSIAREGKKCIRCHYKKTNRDGARMYDLYE